MYARKLTKTELMENGITNVTTDGHVFKGDIEIFPLRTREGYLIHEIYDKDADGNKIKIPKPKAEGQYTYKLRSIGLHRLMWAWHFGEVPCGMVVDHISNRHDTLNDYDMSNLQLLTPGENIAKERDNWNVWELKCQLDKPRSFYENKLKGYEMAYEQAKKDGDAEGAHQLRTNISQTRARLRYYDSHIEEVNARKQAREEAAAKKQAYHDRAAKKKELRANLENTRKLYKRVREAYGKDDPYVQKMWGEWKLAIAMYNGFVEECRAAK